MITKKLSYYHVFFCFFLISITLTCDPGGLVRVYMCLLPHGVWRWRRRVCGLDFQRVLLQILLDDLQIHLGTGGGGHSAPGPPLPAQPNLGHISHLTETEQGVETWHTLWSVCLCDADEGEKHFAWRVTFIRCSLRCSYYQTAHLLLFFMRSIRCSAVHHCSAAHHAGKMLLLRCTQSSILNELCIVYESEILYYLFTFNRIIHCSASY